MLRKKILVIDDEEKIVKMIATRLSAQGYDVVTALGGAAGLVEAKSEKLILLFWIV